MSVIRFERTYALGKEYVTIKNAIEAKLGDYLHSSDIYRFNNSGKCITFATERLVPAHTPNRPRVLLLFSNPHPHSIIQGMFLSPNSRGQESLFWTTMKEAGWIQFSDEITRPSQMAELCYRTEYVSPFEFIFYCYYAFPTRYPQHIKEVFGEAYFNRVIKPESRTEFSEILKSTDVKAVVTFNKEIFDIVTESKVESYLARLKAGGLIQGQVAGISKQIPIYSTFPTGWIYHKNYKEMRRDNLVKIREAICGYLSLL